MEYSFYRCFQAGDLGNEQGSTGQFAGGAVPIAAPDKGEPELQGHFLGPDGGLR